ncbi:MAG: hypothetical protein ACK5RA_05225 [Cyanobacteriota bacterium]
MDPTEAPVPILRTPVPFGGRGRGRGGIAGVTPDRARFFDTRDIRAAASPIAQGEDEEDLVPRMTRMRTTELEEETVPRPKSWEVTLSMILDRLDRLEGRRPEIPEEPESRERKREVRRETMFTEERVPASREKSRMEKPETYSEARRETVFTEGGTPISHGKPKMEKPETFNGEYTVMYSVLNWLRSVRKYLKPYNIPTHMYPQYAYTYMGKSVKAWYDAKFATVEDPHWEHFEEAMIERYLPEDHVIQVTKKYEGVIQTGSLTDYVEKWQSLMVAVQTAGISRTDDDHVIQFVTGLSRLEDRKSILDKDPKNLDDVYRAVTKIRHYSLLAHKYTRTGDQGYRHREEKTHLKMLKGAEKALALKEGRCIGCGEKGHFVVKCDKTKKALRVLRKTTELTSRPGPPRYPKAGSRKGVRFNLLEEEGEPESEYDSEENFGDSEIEDGTEEEGEDETMEKEGNEGPGPQGEGPGK